MRGPDRRRGVAAAAIRPLVLLFVLLAGCSSVGAPAATPSSPLPVSTPVWLDVPRIGAHSSLVPLGLNPDGSVQVPSLDAPMQAGWYTGGPAPGEPGPAVLLGHVNARGRQGIFGRLHELAPGDEVDVRRADGRTVLFRVTRVEEVPKTAFPTGEVYGDTAGAELRLITCGGTLDRARGSYRDNVIVFGLIPSPASS